MNSHVRRYFTTFSEDEIPSCPFHEVIELHNQPEISWGDCSKKVKTLPKGWFELSHLNSFDRVEFTCEYWLKTLPYLPQVHHVLEDFFSRLDDIGVFITQKHMNAPYECKMVYSVADESTFFYGSPPCSEEEISFVRHQFKDELPQDFLSFLKIHDGFAKHMDTGIIASSCLEASYQKLQSTFSTQELKVDPSDLIPFYESFGLNAFQCFFAAWYPTAEMGNVYYSLLEEWVSDYNDGNTWLENLAFPTFLDWLAFYLEGVE